MNRRTALISILFFSVTLSAMEELPIEWAVLDLPGMEQPEVSLPVSCVDTLKVLAMRKFLEGIKADSPDVFFNNCSYLPDALKEELKLYWQEKYNLPIYFQQHREELSLRKVLNAFLSRDGNYLFVHGDVSLNRPDWLQIYAITPEGFVLAKQFVEKLPQFEGIRLSFAVHPSETFFMRTTQACYGIEKIAIPSWQPLEAPYVEQSPLHDLAINASGNYYAYIIEFGTIRVRRVHDNMIAHELNGPLEVPLTARLSFGNCATSSLLGVVAQGYEESRLQIWRLPDSEAGFTGLPLATTCTKSCEIHFFNEHAIISSLYDGLVCYMPVNDYLMLDEGCLGGVAGNIRDMSKDGFLFAVAQPGKVKIMRSDNRLRNQEILLTETTSVSPSLNFSAGGESFIMVEPEKCVRLFSRFERSFEQAVFEAALAWYQRNIETLSIDIQRFFLEHEILKTFEDHRRREIEVLIQSLITE